MMELPERIFQKIHFEPNTGCWLWTAAASKDGYGRVSFGGRWQLAHRVVYELLAGPIPDGLTLDHLCRVPRCVNAFGHLQPVTMRENILRGTGPSAQAARQMHCLNGHPLNAESLYHNPAGNRVCRICKNARWMRNYRQRKQAAKWMRDARAR